MIFSGEEFALRTLDYLEQQQQEDGSFRSLESYPTGHPLAEKGWMEHDPSPFIHANVLLSLRNIDHPKASAIIRRGLPFLTSLKEGPGFWRFWPHGGRTHNVPLDMDDTALCSFLLREYGQGVDNEAFLLKNTDSKGYFKTWIFPGSFSFKNLQINRFLKRDLSNLQMILKSDMLAMEDKEPAVAANVLLYLGQHAKAQHCIRQLIEELKTLEDLPLQYYSNPLVAFYHASRAYAYGINALEPLADIFYQHYQKRHLIYPETLFQQALTILTFYQFNLLEAMKRLDFIPAFLDELPIDQSWQPDIYFVSKDRNFRAGSAELTAAICLEAFEKVLA